MVKFGKLLILFVVIIVNSTACSSDPNYFEAVQPTGDDSILYVYRSKVKGVLFQPLSSSYPDLILDGESIDVLKANTHRAIPIKPGKHHLRVTGLTEKARWDQRDKELSFKIKPGEIKYLKINVQYDIKEIDHVSTMNKRAIYITPVDAKDAVYEIRETDPAK